MTAPHRGQLVSEHLNAPPRLLCTELLEPQELEMQFDPPTPPDKP